MNGVRGIFLCLLMMLFISGEPLGQPEDMEDEFKQFTQEQEQQFHKFVEDDQAAFQKFVADVEKKWNEFLDSSKKTWVDYSEDLDARSDVNFEEGTIEVEAVVEADQPDAVEQAKAKIAQQVEKIFSEEDQAGNTILADQVQMPDTQKPVTPENVEQFVKEEVDKKVVVEEKPFQSKDGKKRIKVRVTLGMVPDHVRIRAKRYVPLVKTFSKKHGIEAPLVLAVIHTESYFNPRAKSKAGAYGLMQLIPKYGARDAYRLVHGEDRVVLPSYLYDPKNNVELGTAYLHLLEDQHFKGVDPVKRRYLVIASYNWGPTSVHRKIVQRYSMDRLSDKELYSLLQRKAPQETRDYVKKVTERMRMYAAM